MADGLRAAALYRLVPIRKKRVVFWKQPE